MQNKKNKGFTLIELVIGIALLAIIVAGAAFLISNLGGGAREAMIRSHANSVAANLNTFNNAVVAGQRLTVVPAQANLFNNGSMTIHADPLRTDPTNTAGGIVAGPALGVEITESIVVPADMVGEVHALLGFNPGAMAGLGFFYVRDTPLVP